MRAEPRHFSTNGSGEHWPGAPVDGLGEGAGLSVEVEGEVEVVEVKEDTPADLPDAVLTHLGEHGVPQFSAAQGGGAGHPVACQGSHHHGRHHSLGATEAVHRLAEYEGDAGVDQLGAEHQEAGPDDSPPHRRLLLARPRWPDVTPEFSH